MIGSISEFERIETEERTPRDYFAEDNFVARRSGAGPSNFGNAYDPESLLTGGEIAAGKGYLNPREGKDDPLYLAAIAGKFPVAEISVLFPRQ